MPFKAPASFGLVAHKNSIASAAVIGTNSHYVNMRLSNAYFAATCVSSATISIRWFCCAHCSGVLPSMPVAFTSAP